MAPQEAVAETLAEHPELQAHLETHLRRSARRAAIRSGLVWVIVALLATAGAFWYSNYLSQQRAQDRINEERSNVMAQRAGCQRQNDRIEPIFRFFGDAIATRREAARTDVSARDRRIDLNAAREYANDRRAMVRAVADVAQSPGSPRVNCSEAYPFPSGD